MTVQLNFVNNSNDLNNSSIVIFQKNVATDIEELPVAWKVIQNCSVGDNHPFVWAHEMSVASSDMWGNFHPALGAHPGQGFSVHQTGTGDALSADDPATSPEEVEVRNNLPQGSINANIFKDNHLLAIRTAVSPEQSARFAFKPSIWIGAASQVEQGAVMHTAMVDNVHTELSLLGIASADIVMTGGGAGPDAMPFSFTLENVEHI